MLLKRRGGCYGRHRVARSVRLRYLAEAGQKKARRRYGVRGVNAATAHRSADQQSEHCHAKHIPIQFHITSMRRAEHGRNT